MRIRLFEPAVHPRFDDLPWDVPLADWEHERLVEIPVGLHRHVVRFVDYGGQFYALKELPERPAKREYRLLRTMNDDGLPVVAAVALVDQRGDPEPVVITRYLNYAQPFRHYFADADADADALADVLATSLASLLARLHTAGFYWGDCSLSNAVFRRDGSHLTAFALDAETGDLQDKLSDGQRRLDVETAVVNVAGGLADLSAAGELPEDVDPFEVAPSIAERYEEIWEELHGSSDYDRMDPSAFEHRLARLHELGFSVREAVLTGDANGKTVAFRPAEIEEGFNRRKLFRLTGIAAREQQARRLIDHIRTYRSQLADELGRRVPTTEAAHRWLNDAYDPVVAAIPEHDARKLEEPQMFLEVLDHHRETGGRPDRIDDLVDAARDFGTGELPDRPHERTLAPDR